MKHDKLCPGYHPEGRSRTPDDCWKCALIARVRADERLTMEAPQLYYGKGYEQGQRDALAGNVVIPKAEWDEEVALIKRDEREACIAAVPASICNCFGAADATNHEVWCNYVITVAAIRSRGEK